jgi:hypothetical protein
MHIEAGTPAEWMEKFPSPDEIAPLVLKAAALPGTGRILDAEALQLDPAAALAGDGRLGAQHLAHHAGEQRDPGGDAQEVAEVDVVRADGRDQRVVELGEAAEHDGDGDPPQQQLAAHARAPGQPDGGGHRYFGILRCAAAWHGAIRRSTETSRALIGTYVRRWRKTLTFPTARKVRRPRDDRD